jgi:hypothetical protein
MVSSYKACGPIAIATTEERIAVPTREKEIVRFGNRDVRIHRAKDRKDFFFHPVIGKGFYPLGKVTLSLFVSVFSSRA